MKVLEIIWDDAFYNEGPVGTRHISKEPMRCHDVGYFVEENDLQIVIALEYNAKDENWRHIVVIPKICIVKRRWLRR